MHPQAVMEFPPDVRSLWDRNVYPSQDQTPHNGLNQGSGARLLIKGIPRNRLSPQELNQDHFLGGGHVWGGAQPEFSPSVSPVLKQAHAEAQ